MNKSKRCNYNNLTFGLPLRTNLNHPYGYKLDKIIKGGKEHRRGLDFTKAVLIRDQNKDLGSVFKVSEQQKKILITKKKVIVNHFNRYVDGYAKALLNGKENTLKSQMYRYSTLKNYHAELIDIAELKINE